MPKKHKTFEQEEKHLYQQYATSKSDSQRSI